MNIFALSDSPFESGRWQHDRHVVKMTLETAQLLSTAVWHNPRIKQLWQDCHKFDIRDGDSVETGSLRLYKSISNPNHPVAVWVRESDANLAWTILHMGALIGEYHRRFRKIHACLDVSNGFLPVGAALAGVERVWTRDADRNLIVDPAIVALASTHSPFSLSMPDYCKVAGDAILSYRNVYLNEKIFQSHVKWTRCPSIPAFIVNMGDACGDPRISERVDALVAAHANQQAAPRLERVVAKPHVPAGMGIPSFLRPSA